MEFDFPRPLVMTEKDGARVASSQITDSMWYLKMKVKLNINLSKMIREKIDGK